MSKIEIGKQMKSIYTWIWLSVFFFWVLFIPLIILLIKWFGLASILKANGLNNEGSRLSLALIMTILPFGITQLIGFIFMFLWYGDMQTWTAGQRLTQASAGFGQCKTAMILNIIPLGITQLIGLIMFIFGFPKAYNGLM
ncbi:MAG: hypothetical protein JXA54_02815 [Candidatus Heimdallarchaeota archaeon]|nr:hypothetical protein [Candidatus Heimdallarchaeota archaeon]